MNPLFLRKLELDLYRCMWNFRFRIFFSRGKQWKKLHFLFMYDKKRRIACDIWVYLHTWQIKDDRRYKKYTIFLTHFLIAPRQWPFLNKILSSQENILVETNNYQVQYESSFHRCNNKTTNQIEIKRKKKTRKTHQKYNNSKPILIPQTLYNSSNREKAKWVFIKTP